MSKPKIICLCGSTRFIKTFAEVNLKLTLEGIIVLSVGAVAHSDSELGLDEETKRKLDELHKDKIDLADEILVLNVGGYIGSSTRSEIEYARRFDTRVRFLEGCEFCGEAGETHEECRDKDENRSRYAESRLCPYCGADNGECPDEMHQDDDEHEIQCFECNKYFFTYCSFHLTYRIERSYEDKAK